MNEKTSVKSESSKTTSKKTETTPKQVTHKRDSSYCGSCGVCSSLRSPRVTSENISIAMSQAKATGKESCAVSFMQKNHGNRFTASALAPSIQKTSIQKKCGCGGGCSKDKAEEEAERVSMSIMKMESPMISRKPSVISYQPSANNNEQSVISDIMSNKGSGHGLDDNTSSFMEQGFGYDFSHVRLHTDSYATRKSNELNAEAFTIGRDVFFNAGRYNPSSAGGKQLLAHELTHVVQQGSQPDLMNKKALQRMRKATAGDTIPVCTDGAIFGVPPNTEHVRVDAAIAIVKKVVDDPRNYPRCPTHFEDHCVPGTRTSLRDQYNRAIVWKHTNPAGNGLGRTCTLSSQHIAYTSTSYRSYWSIAASLVHEMMHMCGILGHPPSAMAGYTDILDESKHWCGRLPNI